MIRGASLTDFDRHAREHGLDARALIREVGLPATVLNDADMKVPASAVASLLELATRRSGVMDWGMRMAEGRKLSNLGPLGLLLRDASTLSDALTSIARHIRVHNEALAVDLETGPDVVILRLELTAKVKGPVRQFTELVVGVTHRMLRLFLGTSWTPKLVCFAHAPGASQAHYRRFFGCDVEFGCDFNGIVCRSADLAAPNPGADPVMARYAHQALARDIDDERCATTHRVRELVLLLLPRGHCSADIVAQHMGVDRRTVARRLEREGASFSELLNAVREELALRYLADGSRSLADVSGLLGFSAPSVFSRWFREKMGVPARRFKVQQQAGAAKRAPSVR
ncbi:AraC family transcriptional regulator [Variovorax sp. M-6]|uniref:AraC family transcriptional regulator n=1 Tax=Variovorax sp. M-6 TaxID=3233041 RepID=UPI003F9D6B25